MGKGKWGQRHIQEKQNPGPFIHFLSTGIPDGDSCALTKGGCNSSPPSLPNNDGSESAQQDCGATEEWMKKPELNGEHKHISKLH